MQISITPGGAAAVQLTGTVPAEDVQDFQLASRSSIQSVEGLGAANVTQFPRGNKQLTLSFSIQREHDSAEAAAYFGPSYEAQFPIQGNLTYTTDAGVLYAVGAVAAVTRITVTGATSTVSYRVTSGGFLTTLPTS